MIQRKPFDVADLFIAAPAVELPPHDAAEAEARIDRMARAKAFFASFELPADTDPEAVWNLIDSLNALSPASDAFLRAIARTGEIDRVALRAHLEAYGQIRHALLTLLGVDPDNEDLLPFPVAVPPDA